MSETPPATGQPGRLANCASLARPASPSEKTALASFVLLLFYAIARSLFAAALRPFWYDEVITTIMARLRNLSTLWSALALPADGCPPLFYLIERIASSLSSGEQVAYRLPSILGFAVTLVCVFVFIRKRDGNEIAAICSGGLLITVLYGKYAIEARPYSLVVACVALALVCYQHAPKAGWMIIMGCVLALSEALHYYAVFGLVPFGVAEVSLFRHTRRFRWGVWLALIAGVVPLTVFWPLLNAMRATFGAHYWAQPNFAVAVGAFVTVWDAHWILQVVIGATVLHRFSSLVPTVRAELLPWVMSGEIDSNQPWIHERLLAFVFLAIPFVTLVAASLMHGGLADRYMILAVFGFPLVGAYFLSRVDRRVVRKVSFSVLCVVVAHEGVFWFHREQPVGFMAPFAAVKKLVDSVGYEDLPVVVSDGVAYVPINHYAAPESAKRFVFLTDVPQEILYSGTDSVGKELMFLKRYVPLEIYDYQEFASRHKRFLLYSDSNAQFDWWPWRFAKEGYSIQALAESGPSKIYLVRLGQPPIESRCGSGC